MQVVILAGGLGTRLPTPAGIPKAMALVAGRPFLEWQIESFVAQGLSRVLLCVGHLAEAIVRHVGDGARFGARVAYSREPAPHGTGGALRGALGELDETFLLAYGDSLLLEPVAPVVQALARHPGEACMTVFRDAAGVTGVAPNVAIDGDGRVACYHKDAPPGRADHVEAGLVGLRREMIAGLPAELPTSLESDLYPALVAARRVRAYPARQPFFDIGTPARLRRAEAFLCARAAGGSP